MIFSVDATTNRIILGVVGDDNVTEVHFDVKPWVDAYGDSGLFSLLNKRQGDTTAYPVEIRREGNTVIWTVSEIDTAKKGYGECELCYVVDDKTKYSRIFSTILHRSFIEVESPEPYEIWLDKLLKVEDKANANETKIQENTTDIEQNAADISNIKQDIIELEERKGEVIKLYFDGDAIYESYEAWEDAEAPMTFEEIADLAYRKRDMVYLGDGQMKYYPQLDLNVPTKDSRAIEFMSSGQLDGENFFTRVIINENNEVKTDQIVDINTTVFAQYKNEVASEFATRDAAIQTADTKAGNAQTYAEGVNTDLQAFKPTVPTMDEFNRLSESIIEIDDEMTHVLSLTRVKDITFTRYGISRTTGELNAVSNRAISSLIKCNYGDVVSVNKNYKYWLAYYTTSGYVGNSYDTTGDWYSGNTYIKHEGLFILVVSKKDETAFSKDEIIGLNNNIATLHSANPSAVNGIVFGAGHITTEDNAEYYALQGNDYFYYNFNVQASINTNRWRTENKVLFKAGTTISVASGYRFYIFKYVNGSVINGIWLTGTYKFEEDTLVRMLFDTVNDNVLYTAYPPLDTILFIKSGDEYNPDDVKTLSNEIDLIKDKFVENLYTGNFVQGGYTATGIQDRNDRIVMNDAVALPVKNVPFTVRINPNYIIGIRVGATANNLSSNLYWYTDGDEITIPESANYYRITIANAGGGDTHTLNISPSEIESIALSIQYEKVYINNEASNKRLSNARLKISGSGNNLFTNPVIAHTSDCHGDYKRVNNFFDFCDRERIDVACITGDIVSYDPSQGIKWFMESVKNHKTLSAVCTGNHDVYNNNYTDNDIYNFMFADIASKIGNETGKTWYYKDVPLKKIRIISVNLYQYGGESRWYTHFTQEQINWVVNTLKTVPSGYGVLMLEHAPQVILDNAKSENYGEFFQNNRPYNNTHNQVNGAPIYDIIDAFISKGSISKSYTQSGFPSSISVSADFSSVANGVEFIAHLTGHFHQDTICYLPNTARKQLMLNVTCTNAIYGGSAYPYLADIADQGRYYGDESGDSFNVYVIDRSNKNVKIVRVGNDMTYDMTERKYMVIPYAD